MYGKGVKHKDLKAENMLVYAYPDRLIAKLCDFGFARQSTATMSHAGGGTASFEAPEVRATGNASFASDVFSAGMTAVQILTRATPGRLDWRNQVLRAIEQSVETTSKPRSQAHSRLQDLLLRMIEVEQARRPNALECAKAVDAIIESLGGDPRTQDSSPDYDSIEEIEEQIKKVKKAKTRLSFYSPAAKPTTDVEIGNHSRGSNPSTSSDAATAALSSATSYASSSSTSTSVSYTPKDEACLSSLRDWLESEADIPPRRAAEYAAVIYDKGGEYKPARIFDRLQKAPDFLTSLGVDKAHSGYIQEALSKMT